MMLTEVAPTPTGDLPLAAFKDHLRLGSGFTDDGLQDPVLESVFRAALSAIEARTGKVLLNRSFEWSLEAWRDAQRQPLPLAPVAAITGFVLIDTLGGSTQAPDTWRLSPDMQRPLIVATAGCLPSIPPHGSARITMTAGFGADWGDLPADLAHAVMLLAAHYYEFRHEAESATTRMPFGVSTLIERYRTVRLFSGGRT